MANIISLKLHACAKAAKQLMQNGMTGPKVEEIAEKAHGELWPIGKEEIEWVINHLSKIKAILESEEDLSVCLINREYYTQFRRRMPATVEAAKIVLPKRGDYRGAGLHFVTSEGDTIWLASQSRIGDVGTGAFRKIKVNISREVKNNRLTANNGDQFVKALKDKV